MSEQPIPWPPPTPSILDEPPTVKGYRPLHRVDDGDRDRTFFAIHEETEVRAALKLFDPEHGDWLSHRRYSYPSHPRIPQILDDGILDDGLLDDGLLDGEVTYIVRQWAPGTPFAALTRRPPSFEGTRRLCRAVLEVAEVIEWMHTDGGTCEYLWKTGGAYESIRVHGTLGPENVIVTPSGSGALINCDGSRSLGMATWENQEEFLSGQMRDPRLHDLDAVLDLFRSIWTPLDTTVVRFDAAVPGPIAALRNTDYFTIHDFREDLADAIMTAWPDLLEGT